MTLRDVFTIGLYHGYIPQILLAEALFTLWLKRREHFALRLAVGLPVYLAVSVAAPNIIASFASGWFSITIFAFSLVLCIVLFDAKVTDILFCCVCAQLTQNLSYNVENLIYLPLESRVTSAGWLAISLGSMAVTYAVSFFVFSHRMRRGAEINLAGWIVFPLAILTMLFVYVMQYFFQVYGIDRLWVSRPPLIVCCIFGLSLQFGLLAYKKELEEKDRLEYFLRQANRQYEMNRANIDLINMKAHDLKHFIGRVKELSGSAEELTEMENAVHQYEKTVTCGNNALDALLTDKQYQCIAAGIDLTLMVDGAELNFMRTADIVSLFSNAMDNAIECELSVDDPARRSISLKVDRRGSFVCVHAENYCEQAPLIRDGLPVTSKADPNFHGFGVKSIRYVAEKYGGSMSVGVREHTFALNVLLPIP